MPCYGPLTGYYPKITSGDKRLVFRKDQSETGIGIKIPCGRCTGCRLEHSRQWAVRCMHEKRLHSASCFVTLTYDNDHLPANGSLVKRDLQLFMKRYRKIAGNGIRFFACGEYGEKTNRPHYHLLLLNSDFDDKRLISRGSEYSLYASALLSSLWPAGQHALGDVSFESAAYVARYCMKKITGPGAAAHYNGREKEFIVMSRRPGLGTGYFDCYQSEILSHDTIIVNGVPAALPRFYDNKLAGLTQLSETSKIAMYTKLELVKIARRRKLNRADSGTTRLRIREAVSIAKLNLKRRSL